MLVEKCLGRKKFLVEIFFDRNFFCWKIISSETVRMKKVWSKIFLLQNQFLEKVWMKKIWSKNFLVENLFVAKSFPRKQFGWKKFWSRNFLVENFFVAKPFTRKLFRKKKFGRNIFLAENFFVSKSFPRKQFGWKKNFRKFFGGKFFVRKIISSETVWMKKILFEKCFVQMMQNHILGHRLVGKKF